MQVWPRSNNFRGSVQHSSLPLVISSEAIMVHNRNCWWWFPVWDTLSAIHSEGGEGQGRGTGGLKTIKRLRTPVLYQKHGTKPFKYENVHCGEQKDASMLYVDYAWRPTLHTATLWSATEKNRLQVLASFCAILVPFVVSRLILVQAHTRFRSLFLASSYLIVVPLILFPSVFLVSEERPSQKLACWFFY